ncbi:MAG: copper amine oxidase N-terminal domain-containing protein [Peptococcaceae bacterium]|nr:copper amine oxidase N-terminal domain-containing protein [Peptococcaceae bacterium]MDH7526229.1 copper amine oxidase N-terminal domain-containing protein [Peptococcaceae bacterium]
MKKLAILLLMLCAAGIQASFPVLLAADEIRVYVDGTPVAFPDQKPVITGEKRTLVPVRFVTQVLGADVFWDEVTKTAVIENQGKTVTIRSGEKKATIDSAEVALDTGAALMNGRMMVPLRFVSECLGAHVEWNGSQRAVYIATDLSPASIFSGQPYRDLGLPAAGDAQPTASRQPGARVQYVESKELPVDLGGYIIYSVAINDEHICVKQYSRDGSPCPLYIAENGIITRARLFPADIQPSSIFVYKYPLAGEASSEAGLGVLKARNISHLMFEGCINGDPVYLVVNNSSSSSIK